jgi:hypothetical protein
MCPLITLKIIGAGLYVTLSTSKPPVQERDTDSLVFQVGRSDYVDA